MCPNVPNGVILWCQLPMVRILYPDSNSHICISRYDFVYLENGDLSRMKNMIVKIWAIAVTFQIIFCSYEFFLRSYIHFIESFAYGNVVYDTTIISRYKWNRVCEEIKHLAGLRMDHAPFTHLWLSMPN